MPEAEQNKGTLQGITLEAENEDMVGETEESTTPSLLDAVDVGEHETALVENTIQDGINKEYDELHDYLDHRELIRDKLKQLMSKSILSVQDDHRVADYRKEITTMTRKIKQLRARIKQSIANEEGDDYSTALSALKDITPGISEKRKCTTDRVFRPPKFQKVVEDDTSVTKYNERIEKMNEESRGFDIEDVEMAPGYVVQGELYNILLKYQRVGLEWLLLLFISGKGGILGDDLGLGKTVQLISLVATLRHSDRMKNCLIMMPASLLQQWVDEFNFFAPTVRIVVFHSDWQDNLSEMLITRSQIEPTVMITTYDTFRNYAETFCSIEWQLCALDEGHKIKNPNANITLAVKHIRCMSRFILSGTPLQNSLSELWSLFDFCSPGLLGTLPVFEDNFANPIHFGGYVNATPQIIARATATAEALRHLIKPYLLRRLKSEVLELPDKDEMIIFCRLTKIQEEQYTTFLRSETVVKILSNQMTSFGGMMELRKITNHPFLHDEEMDLNLMDSGKFRVVRDLLRRVRDDNRDLEWKDKHKVLIFSQLRMTLDLLEMFVREEGYTYARLDGTVNVGKRKAIIEYFSDKSEDSPFIFLLTTKVANLGLNLHAADRVIIFDPDWNPTVDQQSRDRAHRMGQESKVHVYRLITKGTIEECIYERQIFKQNLINRVLVNPSQKKYLEKRSLKELFTYRPPPKKGPEKQQVNEFKSVDEEFLATLLNVDTVETVSATLATVEDGEQISEAARQAAVRATRNVKASTLGMSNNDRFAPTWTGSKGTVGHRKKHSHTKTMRQRMRMIDNAIQKEEHKITSGDVLKNIRQRIETTERDRIAMEEADLGSLRSDEDMNTKATVMATGLKKLFDENERLVTSDIVTAFQQFVKGKDAVLFKEVLHALAEQRFGFWFMRE
ncbi:hypothetical protein PCE1_000944 [Barthelona sp. PCE]